MSKKDKPIVLANWDDEVNTIFCEICVEEVEAGNRPLGRLSAKGYSNLVEKFNARTGRPYVHSQLKNRWDSLKNLFDFWLSLLANTGLGMDHELGTVSASDEFWEAHTKGNKEKKALRFGPPPNKELLGIMFDKSTVSGLSSCIPGQLDGSHRIDLDGASENEDKAESSKKTGAAHKDLKRKSVNSPGSKKGRNPMVRCINRMVDDVISANFVTSRAISGDVTVEAVRQVMTLAKESGAAEGSDEHFMATQLFVKTENRAMFLTFDTNEGRFNWLKRCYKEYEEKKKRRG